MYKGKMIRFFSIFIVVVILFTACRSGVPTNNNQEAMTNDYDNEQNDGIDTRKGESNSNDDESTVPQKITPTQILTDYNKIRGLEINKLNEISSKLIDLKNPIIGYNSMGDIVVWASSGGDLITNVNVDVTFEGFYHHYPCYLAYTNLKEFPDINEIWIYNSTTIDYSLSRLTRDTFNKSYNSDIFNIENFLLYENNNILDYYYYFENVPDTFQASTKPLERILALIFKDRITDIKVDNAGCFDALSLIVYLDKKVLDNINDYDFAQMFIYSIGMYEPLYWNNFLTAGVKIGNDNDDGWTFGMADTEYEAWKESGFKLSDWWKYCKYKNPEDQILFSSNDKSVTQSKVEDQLIPEQTSNDLSYDEMMSRLKEIYDVNIISLGESDKGFQAVLSFECQSEEELYKQQYDALITCMKLPIETLWFKSYVEGRTYISCMERERFNELNYNGDKFEEYFLPEDWPVFASIYWAD